MTYIDAPAEGYPVRIALPRYANGPLTLSFRDGSRAEFAVEDGHAEATTRARADMLLAVGGHIAAPAEQPTDTPPNGSGTKSRPKRGTP